MSDKQQIFFEKCYQGEFIEVKRLLEQGINPNAIQSFSVFDRSYSKELSALCVAAKEGHLEITNILVKHGADINYRCQQGESALFLAVRHGHLKVAQCLLEAGASVVYTAKTGEKVMLENWEVFTQALLKAYPKHINDAVNAPYKAVVQLLLEHNSNSQRPSTLYEALYCSLTVFANPIAVYCVGAYAVLGSEQPYVVFCEENFVGALCHAFDTPHAASFISTVQSVLSAYKLRQKDVVQSLVKNFNWADLLRGFAENSIRGTTMDGFDVIKVLDQLMEIMFIIISNFHVRLEVQSQFAALTSEDIGRMGRLFKSLLDQQDNNGSTAKGSAWQIFFFLLKHQLRTQQDSNVARLLVRTGWSKGKDSSSSVPEFERRVLLRCVDDDISLAHLLIDFGVPVNGECFVKFVQDGHVDLVDRCVTDNELLFCKEILTLLQTPLVERNSTNRNMRRCIRVIKNRKKSVEEEKSKYEEELLNDDPLPNKGGKRKKQRSRAKQSLCNSSTKSVPLSSSVPKDDKSDTLSVERQCVVSSGDAEKVTRDIENSIDSSIESLPDVLIQNSMAGDYPSGCKPSQNLYSKGKSKKKRHKKKNSGKCKSDPVPIPETASSGANTNSDGPCDSFDISNNWRDLVMTSSRRRRRQSSSSSDASVGSKKTVHFSHPLTFYENTKLTEKSRHLKIPKGVGPKASNLKQSVDEEIQFDFPMLQRRNNKPIPEHKNNLSRLNSIEPFDDCFDDELDGFLRWRSMSHRWAPRFEDLSETSMDRLKQIHWSKDGDNEVTYFCDNQKHLNIGSGPDFSQIFLGLTKKGLEVSIKKINSKRAPLLGQADVLRSLLALGEHCNVNKYHSIERQKGHYYVMQTVGDFSLVQVVRKKMILLPGSLAESCHQIASGLDYLHRNDILHMALKPSNIFLGSDSKLRIADYGIHQRFQSDDHKRMSGPAMSCMCWMAWETMLPSNQAKFSTQSDVTCLGMVVFYILTNGSHPFGDPDASPGECMCNINKTMYNLKGLTDPLAHHLVTNMLLKEPGKRLKTAEVLTHPFFWNDKDKDSFIDALTEVVLADEDHSNSRSILENLKDHEQDIVKGTYARAEHFIGATERISSVEEILLFFRECIQDSELFDRHTKSEIRTLAPFPSRYFLVSFPGLLLHGCKIVSLNELKNSSKAIAAARKRSIEQSYDSQNSSVSPTLLNGQDDPAVFSQSCDVLHQGPAYDLHQESLDLMEDDKEIDRSTDAQIFQTQTYKKNTSLCLSDAQSNFNNNVQLLEKENDHICSPCSADKHPSTFLDNNWNDKAGMENGDKIGNNSSASGKYFDQRNQLKADKTGSLSEQFDLPQVSSPDDWIEIGSPLVDEGSDVADISKGLSITLSKGNNSNFSDDCETGSSSSCSVDACFDFDKFPGFPGMERQSAPQKFVKEAEVFAFSSIDTSQFLYTDIDELD